MVIIYSTTSTFFFKFFLLTFSRNELQAKICTATNTFVNHFVKLLINKTKYVKKQINKLPNIVRNYLEFTSISHLFILYLL